MNVNISVALAKVRGKLVYTYLYRVTVFPQRLRAHQRPSGRGQPERPMLAAVRRAGRHAHRVVPAQPGRVRDARRAQVPATVRHGDGHDVRTHDRRDERVPGCVPCQHA